MPIQVTTRKLRVENVVGDVMRQVNVVRDIDLPVYARSVESVDTEIKKKEYKIIDNKVIVELTIHRQVYYVEAVTCDVQELTLPDEKITEFVHVDGAYPDSDMTVKVKADIEYCDVDCVDMPDDCGCHKKFQQTAIIQLRVKVLEMVDLPVITSVSGDGVSPTYEKIAVNHVVAAGSQQYNLSDSYIEMPGNTKKIKCIDADIRDVETKIIPDKVIVKGVLHKQIYYVLQGTGEVKETHADVPFSVFVHLDGVDTDSNVRSDVDIEYIDSELVCRGGGKYVKEIIILKVMARATEHIALNVVTSVKGARAETRSLRTENLIGSAFRQVNIVEDIATPVPARKISWVESELKNLEGEAIPNKVIVKGVLEKHIFYVADCDDQVKEVCVQEPFTEFIHIDGTQKDDVVEVKARVEHVNVEAIHDKPTCSWRQTAVIEVCGIVTETVNINVVTNVFELPAPAPAPAASAAVNPDQGKPGQTACVPGTATLYTVRKGDSLYKIARDRGISLDAVLRANPSLKNPNAIKAGDIIQLPCPEGKG
jgi:LysM repeat protein